MIFYIVLLYFTILRLFLKKATKTAMIRTGVMSGFLIFMIVSSILVITIQLRITFWHKVTAFLIIMFFIRSLRESWKRIFLVVWSSQTIMVVIFAYILYMGLLGFALFQGKTFYNDPAEYFQDVTLTMFNMYVLFTTSNFPDIIFPYYKYNNLTVVFFIGFLFFGLYLLLNLMLAVFYNGYRHQIEKKIHKYDDIRFQFLKSEFDKVSGSEHE